jgi:hypothetical protein
LQALIEYHNLIELLKLIPSVKAMVTRDQSQNNSDYFTILTEMSELMGPANINDKIEITYPKELFKYTLDLLESPNSLNLISLFDIVKYKKLSLIINRDFNDKISNGNLKLKLLNDEVVEFDIVANNKNNYSSTQKIQATEIYSDYMQKIFNRDFNKFANPQSQPIIFEAADFNNIMTPILNIRDLNISGHISYSKLDHSLNSVISAKINNLDLKYSGMFKDKLFESELNCSHPVKLLNFITDFYSSNWSPITNKLKDNDSVKYFNKVASSFKQFGPDALEVLNNNKSLKNDEPLLIIIKNNGESQSIKVNDTYPSELLMDKRIQKLIENLNYETEEYKVKLLNK